VWIGLIWFRIWTSGRLLQTEWWTFRFHKIKITYWFAENQSVIINQQMTDLCIYYITLPLKDSSTMWDDDINKDQNMQDSLRF
jgi:hypothetical protein